MDGERDSLTGTIVSLVSLIDIINPGSRWSRPCTRVTQRGTGRAGRVRIYC